MNCVLVYMGYVWLLYGNSTVQSVLRLMLCNKILQYIKYLFDLFLAPCVEVKVQHVSCHSSYV